MSENRERELFEAALERPADERAAFLLSACDGDPALAKRIEQLLSAHEQADLTATPFHGRDGLAADQPSQIGPYRIGREGSPQGLPVGMGTIH